MKNPLSDISLNRFLGKNSGFIVTEAQRRFYLADFPEGLIFVRLEKKFRDALFRKSLDFLHLGQLAGLFGLKQETISLWIDGYRESPAEKTFLPLSSFKDLAKMIKERGGNLNVLEDLDDHIEGMKGHASSGVLNQPKLPVLEDEKLVRLVVHLIGDGYLPKLRGTARTPAYTNGNDFLRLQFHELLGEVFGNVAECSRSYVDRSGKSRSYIAFAKWLGYLIRHWYPDAKFGELTGCLPSAFFQLSMDSKAEMVRTFGDDDGHVGAHSIRFTSGGATILEQIRRLIMELMESTVTPEECKSLVKSVGEVKPFRSWFILDVYRPLFAWYAEYIGFTHPDRAERLAFQLECDRAWSERGLDGFDLDFLTLIGL